MADETFALAVRQEFERVATPLLAQIAANKAETATLKKQNDEYALRIMPASDTVH
jgi:hypothetical protein